VAHVELQTGASRFPVKNFLIFLAVLICCGVTFGSFVHSFPGSLHTKYVFLLQPVRGSSFGTTGGGLKTGFGGSYSSSSEKPQNNTRHQQRTNLSMISWYCTLKYYNSLHPLLVVH